MTPHPPEAEQNAYIPGLKQAFAKLVHEDMTAHFDAYLSRRIRGELAPDASTDQRRALNRQTYFEPCGCQIWRRASSCGRSASETAGNRRSPHLAALRPLSHIGSRPALPAQSRFGYQAGRGGSH